MSLNRYAKKRDANERGIIELLRARGYVVEQLDVCDLLVGHPDDPGFLRLLEVKGKRGRLTPRQVEFRKRFRVAVVRDGVDALAAVWRDVQMEAGHG